MIHEISSTKTSPIRDNDTRTPSHQTHPTKAKRTARISIKPFGLEKGSSSSKPNLTSSSKPSKPSFIKHGLHSLNEPLPHPNIYSLDHSPPRTSHSPTFSLNREPTTTPTSPSWETRNNLDHMEEVPLPPSFLEPLPTSQNEEPQSQIEHPQNIHSPPGPNQDNNCPNCLNTQELVQEARNEIHFMFNHLLAKLDQINKSTHP